MQSHARAVIIGGGIAGCSALYHLTQEGWTDVLLLERDELTAGSTWHAAAQVTQFGANQTMVALKRHSIDLYQRLAADPDHPFDHHITGGMRLAHTRDQLDTYHHHVSLARGVGVEMGVIDVAEVGRRHPLLDTTGLLGAWWDPLDGYIDPNGITQALARQAREAGATVLRQAPVCAIRRTASGEFVVTVPQGEITCEKLVNAAGYRCNEVGALLGVRHPVTSMEHMYFLTEALPEIEALDCQVPVIRDPGDDFYSRQEKQGLLVGVYEQGCKTFGMDGIDPDFTRALCPSDLDRCLDNMERIFERMPALQNTGIHTVVNGPITYTIDGLPLVGPVPGVPGYYCITGLRAGIGEGGGHGKVLAQTLVHGECEWDAWCLDPRRFSQYANTEFTCLKAIEDYRNEFHYHLPHEHRPAGRLARTTPLYTTLEAAGAHFGTVAGWERALYFSADPSVQHMPGFRFDATRAVVAQEVAAVRDGVGLMEVSGFNRYELQGPGAADMLDRLVCGAIPRAPGQVRLCYLLNPHGHLLAEATLVCLGEDHYWYGSAAAAEWHDRDWLLQHKPDTVQLIERAATHTALVVAGPRSRALLQSLAPRADFDAAAFRPMQARWVTLGHAECLAMRVSYSGELAWELHGPNEQLLLMWRTLMTAAEEFSLRPFGLFAAESMRVEKGFFHWKAELITERNPMELGLSRFVNLDKDFIGREALQREIARGDRRRIAALQVASDIAPLHAGDSLYDGDRLVGTVTAGAWGHRVGANLALALIEPDCAVEGQVLGADLLGERVRATVGPACHYDAGHARVRA